MNSRLFVILSAALPVMLGLQAFAQYSMPRSVIGGGATFCSGGGFGISGTVAQPAIGVSSETAKRAYAGFWHTLAEFTVGLSPLPENAAPSIIGLYPNPASHRVTVNRRQKAAPAELRVTDFRGRTMRNLLSSGDEYIEIDVNTLPPGMYIVTLRTASREERRALIVAR